MLKSPQDAARHPAHAPNSVATAQPASPQQTSPQREAVRSPQQPPPHLPEPASVPSFLGSSGKSHADRERARYLLEDEPKPANYGGKFLVLLLFFAVMGAAVWHWHQNLRDFGAKLVQPAAQSNPQSADTSAASSPAGAGATTSPGTDANGSSPNTSAGNAPPNSSVPGNPSPADSPAQPPLATPSATPAPSPSQPSATPQDQSSTSQPRTATQNQVTPPAETATPPSESSTPKATRRTAKPAATQAAPAPAAAGDSLETEGEKYLYGNGVRQNCGRAQKKLTAAANHADARALSVLGTMYATGHCAPRDLPRAYRWFAKALHQDPANTRIEDDLKALWNQMTPDERQLALRKQ